ncbi:glycolate oxidase subunit GlcE [Nitrosomonas sp. Nm132]|uniref:glycolate oxidase subunit GlcE n=1 Tax=Nitrosomonas sp. Nm132 TaxID=1881053 RepID=UPI00088A5701|nr:glycolate oxidase subunit GlcE [Nitrosomonas sp. Nm132]SDH92696.1 glycolate oxidase FAD binding subunit [Nitrosomonas sp. Nm132]
MLNTVEHFIHVIGAAARNKKPLSIRGGNSKHFYGGRLTEQMCDTLNVATYSGLVNYEPSELVVTARAGTRLTDLETILSEHHQMLAFEPPHFGENATLGGCIATGLSGPRRAYTGAVRDFVLGVRILDGRGDDLHFGGQVMKNVAGYDVSRLMTGAMGTLGVLLEVSLKVLPTPPMEISLCMPMKESEAINKMHQWASKPLPISATCFYDGNLFVRLSGAEAAVHAARIKIGGEEINQGELFWQRIREHTHTFFSSGTRLWRLSIKSSTPPLLLPGQQLIEWGGALRWLATDENLNEKRVRSQAEAAGGHATLFYGDKLSLQAFHPLTTHMMALHQRLKQKFDPAGIFNPGRMYPEY